jgi:hypothetical protein
LFGGALYVLDSDAPAGARALNLGEVHAELLGPLPCGLSGVGLFLSAPSGGLLSLLGGLSCGFLGLLSRSACGFLSLVCRLARGVLHTLRDLSDLPANLPRGFLSLARYLAHGLLRLLQCLVYRVHHPEVLSRLVERTLDGLVGIDQLLYLRLRFLRWHLLGQALQLSTVGLQLALEPTERLSVEVLSTLYGLLLYLLLQVLSVFSHYLSFLEGFFLVL